MSFDLVQIRRQAEEKEDENHRFRQFLKFKCKLKAEEIDQRVFAATRRVWAGIDCTKCANCCREVHPTFSEGEIDRLARRLAMTSEQFIEAFLQRSEPGDDTPWKTRTTPCPCKTTSVVCMRTVLPIAAAIHISMNRISDLALWEWLGGHSPVQLFGRYWKS